MNKKDLVQYLRDRTDLGREQSEQVIETIFVGIGKALSQGEKVTFVGFGTFSVIDRKERQGRNPQTGAQIRIPASKQVKFVPGKTLKDLVQS